MLIINWLINSFDYSIKAFILLPFWFRFVSNAFELGFSFHETCGLSLFVWTYILCRTTIWYSDMLDALSACDLFSHWWCFNTYHVHLISDYYVYCWSFHEGLWVSYVLLCFTMDICLFDIFPILLFIPHCLLISLPWEVGIEMHELKTYPCRHCKSV